MGWKPKNERALNNPSSIKAKGKGAQKKWSEIDFPATKVWWASITPDGTLHLGETDTDQVSSIGLGDETFDTEEDRNVYVDQFVAGRDATNNTFDHVSQSWVPGAPE